MKCIAGVLSLWREQVSRRSCLIMAVLAFAIVWHAPAPALADETERPNVLLLLVDDLKPTLGAYGDKLAVSPNIDRLAQRGLRFEMAYCNQAICAPSRINLMTGMRSTTTGIYGLSKDLRQAFPDVVTLPQYFMQHGYHAEAIGKVYHFGHGSVGDPASWSIPTWHESPIDYAMIESTGGKLTREEAFFNNWKGGRVRDLPRGAAWEKPDVEDDVYADGRIAHQAVRRLRILAERKEPFFMAVGFTKPHLPFCAPQKYWDLYDPERFPLPKRVTAPEGAPPFAGKQHRGEMGNYDPIPGGKKPLSDALTRTLIHGYYASTSYMDAQLGLVLDELERLKLSEKTIVVLWGDHGFHLGDLGIWTKHTNYEQAVRIPIMIAAPGVSRPNSVTQALAETVDIYPTLVALAGLPEPSRSQKIDGANLTPVLRDPQKTVRDHAYHAYPRGKRIGRAIRTDRYRLVEWKVPGEPTKTAKFELYDYANDPIETKNIASSEPEVLKRLQAMLAQHPEAVRY